MSWWWSQGWVYGGIPEPCEAKEESELEEEALLVRKALMHQPKSSYPAEAGMEGAPLEDSQVVDLRRYAGRGSGGMQAFLKEEGEGKWIVLPAFDEVCGHGSMLGDEPEAIWRSSAGYALALAYPLAKGLILTGIHDPAQVRALSDALRRLANAYPRSPAPSLVLGVDSPTAIEVAALLRAALPEEAVTGLAGCPAAYAAAEAASGRGSWSPLAGQPETQGYRGHYVLLLEKVAAELGLPVVWAAPLQAAEVPIAGDAIEPSVTTVVETAVSCLLQYLAHLCGGHSGRLTLHTACGTVHLDVETAECLRRWLWLHCRSEPALEVEVNGVTEELSPSQFEAMARSCLNTIVKTGHAQVQCTRASKIAYDIALAASLSLVLDAEPALSLIEPLAVHLLRRFSGNPMAVARRVHAYTVPSHGWASLENLAPYATVRFVTNDTFAPAENLLKSDYPAFQPHEFGVQGQVYDGWESIRHNLNPPDRCELQFERPMCLAGVNVATLHFNGNHARGVSLDALVSYRVGRRVVQRWVQVIPQMPLMGNQWHWIAAERRLTARVFRLNNYPDGGIARLEMFGEWAEAESVLDDAQETQERLSRWMENVPRQLGFSKDFVPVFLSRTDRAKLEAHGKPTPLDASALESILHVPEGMVDLALDATVIASSSATYSVPSNLFKPSRGIHMGDGWETSRMRPENVFELQGPVETTFHFVVAKLRHPGKVLGVGVDTLHFRNNSPLAITVEGCSSSHLDESNYFSHDHRWHWVLPLSPLRPHAEHALSPSVDASSAPITHILIKVYPCGGFSRLRLFGANA